MKKYGGQGEDSDYQNVPIATYENGNEQTRRLLNLLNYAKGSWPKCTILTEHLNKQINDQNNHIYKEIINN